MTDSTRILPDPDPSSTGDKWTAPLFPDAPPIDDSPPHGGAPIDNSGDEPAPDDPGPQGEPGPAPAPRKKRFAKIPLAFLTDDRLKFNDHKVYCAIRMHSFANGECYVFRQTLADLTGLWPTTITAITRNLEALGWIRKTGDGGRSRPARYEVFDEPTGERVAKSTTVSDEKRVAKSTTVSSERVAKSTTVSGLKGSEIHYPQRREKILKDGGGGDTGIAPSGAAAAAADSPISDSVPYDEIVALYHELLPGNPEVKGLTKKRREAIKAIWLNHPDLTWWQNYFEFASRIPLITGDVPARPGYAEPWIADLFDLMDEDKIEDMRSCKPPYVAVAKTPAPPPKPAGQCITCKNGELADVVVGSTDPTLFWCWLTRQKHSPTYGCADYQAE